MMDEDEKNDGADAGGLLLRWKRFWGGGGNSKQGHAREWNRKALQLFRRVYTNIQTRAHTHSQTQTHKQTHTKIAASAAAGWLAG